METVQLMLADSERERERERETITRSLGCFTTTAL